MPRAAFDDDTESFGCDPSKYHVPDVQVHVWSTKSNLLQLVNGPDPADTISRKAVLLVGQKKAQVYCEERRVMMETIWGKDIGSVSQPQKAVNRISGETEFTVALHAPQGATAHFAARDSADDNGAFTVRKLASGVVIRQSVQRKHRTWATVLIVCRSGEVAEDVHRALEALRVRFLQSIPHSQVADRGICERASILQHRARELLAKWNIRPEGVLPAPAQVKGRPIAAPLRLTAGPSASPLPWQPTSSEYEEIVGSSDEDLDNNKTSGLLSSSDDEERGGLTDDKKRLRHIVQRVFAEPFVPMRSLVNDVVKSTYDSAPQKSAAVDSVPAVRNKEEITPRPIIPPPQAPLSPSAYEPIVGSPRSTHVPTPVSAVARRTEELIQKLRAPNSAGAASQGAPSSIGSHTSTALPSAAGSPTAPTASTISRSQQPPLRAAEELDSDSSLEFEVEPLSPEEGRYPAPTAAHSNSGKQRSSHRNSPSGSRRASSPRKQKQHSSRQGGQAEEALSTKHRSSLSESAVPEQRSAEVRVPKAPPVLTSSADETLAAPPTSSQKQETKVPIISATIASGTIASRRFQLPQNVSLKPSATEALQELVATPNPRQPASYSDFNTASDAAPLTPRRGPSQVQIITPPRESRPATPKRTTPTTSGILTTTRRTSPEQQQKDIRNSPAKQCKWCKSGGVDDSHEGRCPQRKIKCKKCGEVLLLKDASKHGCSVGGTPDERKRPSNP